MGVDEDRDDVQLALEAQLRAELCNQLDRHIGRAVPSFLARCGSQTVCWQWRRAAVGVAVAAACCAAIVVWQQTRRTAPSNEKNKAVVVATSKSTPVATRDQRTLTEPVDSGAEKAKASPSEDLDQAASVSRGMASRQPLLLGRALSAQTRDEGTLLVGRTPVRKLRRQWLERVEWFDPQNGARVQRIVPHEEVLFVPLPIN